MKIILSRKGFDSDNGGVPGPIISRPGAGSNSLVFVPPKSSAYTYTPAGDPIFFPIRRPGKNGGYPNFASDVSCVPGCRGDSVARHSSFNTWSRLGVGDRLRGSHLDQDQVSLSSQPPVFPGLLGYLLVNRGYERRYRVRRDEIRGKSDFDIHSREVAEAVRANDLRVIEAGQPSQFEEVLPTADGKRVYLAVKFLLSDRSGKPYAVCGIATDITDLKRSEELEAQMAHERAVFLQEKTRLAGEIHDSLAQSFTAITMRLEMAKEGVTDKDNDALSYVERANDLARFGLAEARRSVLSLQPMIIKDAGLIESLQMLVERSNIPGRLRCTFRSNLESDESLPVVVRQDLLRIAQEAISNALRHAKSTVISVSLRSDSQNLILKVKDNGRGITTKAEAREGFGFVNMRARVKKLHGSLDIRTAPRQGTSIVVCVPIG